MRTKLPPSDAPDITGVRDPEPVRAIGHSGTTRAARRVRAPREGVVGARYKLINAAGQGAMGSVFRVLDLLTGQVVTLKRIKVPALAGTERSMLTSVESRTALAQEFRIAAALRHPNVVTVLDYGFDEHRQPYFTMDLEENARTILEAGADRPLAVQVDLLVQALRAVVYLHQHGIIHRDLTPENILVAGDRVKVVDFGLSIPRQAAERDDVDFAGTPAYMAPEVLRGEPPRESSDLYSVGMVAYELFTGRRLCDEDGYTLPLQVADTVLPTPEDVVDDRVRPILTRLLAYEPGDRYRDASEVITAFAAALDQPLLVETAATRESLLQTAPLVGRDFEVATLLGALQETMRGCGGIWLVSGESGVGKSRLLDEIRTRALIDGVLVVRGHAATQGGGPYHVWRDVLSSLVLRVELNDGEAEVLKAVIPTIGDLVGREIGDAPEMNSEAAQSRLLLAVEELFRLQPGPVLVILEDLHWVGSESLKLLSWMAAPAAMLPILLVGSFRDDEAPDLPSVLATSNLLTLSRLDIEAITALGESLIGPAGRRPELVEFLQRETEGNPFFVIEVVRALAESSGRLTTVAESALPKRVLSGGMRKLVRRRLAQVPRSALAALKAAAVAGRRIDLDLVRRLEPDLAVGEWTVTCARAGVFELRDEQWRFAHDKVREQILDDLSPFARRDLHRRVATAIEALFADWPEYLTALAHHWRQAGDPTREADYAYRAGVLALQSGACVEADAHLRRARELLLVDAAHNGPRESGARSRWQRTVAPALATVAGSRAVPGSAELRLAMVESALSETSFRLGDLAGCREHCEEALRRFGEAVPQGRASWAVAALAQAGLWFGQALTGMHAVDDPDARRIVTEIARVQLRLTDTFYYSLQLAPLVWSSLRAVNGCEAAGPSAEVAQGYMLLALLAGAVPIRGLAERWSRRALQIAERTGSERNVAWMLSRAAVLQLGDCRWADAEAGVVRTVETAERVGDLRLREEAHCQLGALWTYVGEFERATAAFGDAERLSARSGNHQVKCWVALGQGDVLVRRGVHDEAAALLQRAAERIDESAMKSEAIWCFGILALARLRMGDPQGAYEMADRALWHVVTTKPFAYWTEQGMAATAEVFLALLVDGWAPTAAARAAVVTRAAQAVNRLRRYALRFALGRPAAALWSGVAASIAGHERRALWSWRKAVSTAEQLRMPYEAAQAHLEIARHLPAETPGRRHHLDRAIAIFDDLGCAHHLAAARAEQARDQALGVIFS